MVLVESLSRVFRPYLLARSVFWIPIANGMCKYCFQGQICYSRGSIADLSSSSPYFLSASVCSISQLLRAERFSITTSMSMSRWFCAWPAFVSQCLLLYRRHVRWSIAEVGVVLELCYVFQANCLFRMKLNGDELPVTSTPIILSCVETTVLFSSPYSFNWD